MGHTVEDSRRLSGDLLLGHLQLLAPDPLGGRVTDVEAREDEETGEHVHSKDEEASGSSPGRRPGQ